MQDVIIIAVLGCILYAKAIVDNGCVSDEQPCLTKKVDAKNIFWKYFHIIRGNSYFGNMRIPHIIGACQHVLNSVLIYFAFGTNEISFLTSCLYITNPSVCGSGFWTSNWPYRNSLFFVLLMYIFPMGAGVFLAGGLWGSSAAILSWVPFLLVNKWYYLLAFIPLGYLAYKRVKTEIKTHAYLFKQTANKFTWYKPIVIIKTFGYYLRVGLFPIRLGWDVPFLFQYGHTKKATNKAHSINLDFWIGIGAIILVSIGIYQGGAIAYGLIWFTANILCWCNSICTTGKVQERYLIIALPGLMYALVNLLYLTGYPAIVLIFIGAYALKTHLYSDSFRSVYDLIEHIRIEHDNLPTYYVRKGCDLLMNRDFGYGMWHLNEALKRCEGDECVIRYNMAVGLFCLGDLAQARINFLIAKSKLHERTDADYNHVFEKFEKIVAEAEESIKTKGDYQIKEIQVLTIC